MKDIWFVDFPTFKYKEDVSALAIKNGLEVIDSKFDDGKGKKGPKLTLKPQYQVKSNEVKSGTSD